MKAPEKLTATARPTTVSSPASGAGATGGSAGGYSVAGGGRNGAGDRDPGSARRPLTALLDAVLNGVIGFFTSLRLTVVCLALGLVLVFFGTMAQDPMGLYLAQEKFFHSFFVGAAPMWAAIKKTLQMLHVYLPPSSVSDVMYGSRFPVLPGGYLLGGVLLINLVASHFKRFKLTTDKAGIWMVHFGLILLLLGQLGTDIFSRESTLHLRDGDIKNYSESERQVELAVIDTTAPDVDTVVAIPQAVLMHSREIRQPELPFRIRVQDFYANSDVEARGPNSGAPAAATQGIGPQATVRELPRVTAMDQADMPAAVVELVTPEGSLGTWLVSEFVKAPQRFTYNNHSYELKMRRRRYYEPFSLRLLKFQHDIYAGTDIPKNFSSRVRLERPDTGESREVLIYMNSPLRYAGETFYQASYDKDDHGTVLQVVHNPSWLTPYFSCILVGLGLVVQFATHLFGFTFKRKAAA